MVLWPGEPTVTARWGSDRYPVIIGDMFTAHAFIPPYHFEFRLKFKKFTGGSISQHMIIIGKSFHIDVRTIHCAMANGSSYHRRQEKAAQVDQRLADLFTGDVGGFLTHILMESFQTLTPRMLQPVSFRTCYPSWRDAAVIGAIDMPITGMLSILILTRPYRDQPQQSQQIQCNVMQLTF
jgi:hypothetical protein